jgi:hypothetical protein
LISIVFFPGRRGFRTTGGQALRQKVNLSYGAVRTGPTELFAWEQNQTGAKKYENANFVTKISDYRCTAHGPSRWNGWMR